MVVALVAHAKRIHMSAARPKAPSPWRTEWTNTIAKWSIYCSKSDLSDTAVRVRVWRLGTWVDWAQRNQVTPLSTVTPRLVRQFADALWQEQRNRTHLTLASCRLLYEWMCESDNKNDPESLLAFAPTVIERYRILNRKGLHIPNLEVEGASEPSLELPSNLSAFLDQANRCLPNPITPRQFVLWLRLLSGGVLVRELPTLSRESLIRDRHTTYLQLPPGRLFINDASLAAAWNAHFDGDSAHAADAFTEIKNEVRICDHEAISDALAGVLAVYSAPKGPPATSISTARAMA